MALLTIGEKELITARSIRDGRRANAWRVAMPPQEGSSQKTENKARLACAE